MPLPYVAGLCLTPTSHVWLRCALNRGTRKHEANPFHCHVCGRSLCLTLRLKLRTGLMTKRRQKSPLPSEHAATQPSKRHVPEATLEDKVDALINELAAAKTPRVLIIIAVLVICSGRMSHARTLRSVELFAGGAAITRAMQQHHLPAAAVDLQYGRPHDLSSPAGMAPEAQRAKGHILSSASWRGQTHVQDS